MWRRKATVLSEEELKKAIKDSIQTEKDAMDFYRYAAKQMYNERPRLTFKLLAREEREHARSFYEAYRWDDLPPFEDMMNEPPNVDSSWWKELQTSMLGDFDEEMALALAIQREDSLEKELRAIAEQIEDPAVREIYLSNARMTHQHLELIKEDYNLIHLA
ncbi:MAG TPA: ferritin family protein [Geopsychrobacteraceae bacterium]|nr:ferritin family protein [Geopsychrobacteraceae bacterium]